MSLTARLDTLKQGATFAFDATERSLIELRTKAEREGNTCAADAFKDALDALRFDRADVAASFEQDRKVCA